MTRGQVIIRNGALLHCHEGSKEKGYAKQSVHKMKEVIQQTGATPAAAMATVTNGLTASVQMALPIKSAVTRTLRRHRSRAMRGAGDALPPTPTDMNFAMPQQFSDFTLYDSGPGDSRLIIFGQQELVQALSTATFWLCDGTFKIVPTIFFQLYSIHFHFSDGITPVALYCLLPNKTRETYSRLLAQVQCLVPSAAPQVILTDFETAAMSSFAQSYPYASVKGCYFHLTQSILRKVQEVGLKTEYESNDELRCFVRCLAAISHVPNADVVDAFEALVETMPNVEHLDEVVTYFEHTYIRGRRCRGRGENYAPPLFAHDRWNQYDAAGAGVARTNNSCEGWHHAIHSMMQCNHPTMWKFVHGLKLDSALQITSYLQGAAGAERMVEKRYRRIRDRVQRAVALYNLSDVLTFLRAIAYLSYT